MCASIGSMSNVFFELFLVNPIESLLIFCLIPLSVISAYLLCRKRTVTDNDQKAQESPRITLPPPEREDKKVESDVHVNQSFESVISTRSAVSHELLATSRNEVTALSAEVSRLRALLNSTAVQTVSQKLDLSETPVSRKTSFAETPEIDSTIRRASQTIDDLREELSVQTDARIVADTNLRRAQVRASISSWRTDTNYREQIARLQSEHKAALEVVRSEGRRKESTLRNKLSATRSRVSALEDDVKAVQQERDTVVEQYQQLQKMHDDAQTQIQRLSSQLSEAKEQSATLTATVQSLRSQLSEIEFSCSSLQRIVMDREDTIASLRLGQQEAVHAALKQLKQQYTEQTTELERKLIDAQGAAQAAKNAEDTQRLRADNAYKERVTAITLQEEAMKAREKAEKRATAAEEEKNKLVRIVEIKDSEIELAIIDRMTFQKRTEQLTTQVAQLQDELLLQRQQNEQLSNEVAQLRENLDMEHTRTMQEASELTSHTQELVTLRRALQQARSAATVQVSALLKRCEDLQLAVEKRDVALAQLRRKVDRRPSGAV